MTSSTKHPKDTTRKAKTSTDDKSIAKHWAFTNNNYTAAEYEQLNLAEAPSPPRSFLIVGKETGTSGTPHMQGHVSFTTKLRKKQVQENLGFKAHCTVARDIQHSIEYCKKQGDFLLHGTPPPISARPGARTDISSFMSTVESGVCCKRELRKKHPTIMARYPRFATEYISDNRPVPPTEKLNLFPWQHRVVEICDGPIDPRCIYFITDEEGRAGKSTFADYLENKYQNQKKVQIMKPGKLADMAYEYNECTEIFILDCPRSKQGEFIQYDFLENIKDGRLFSPKYESRMKRFIRPHVFVFMNECPDMSKLSTDRYIFIDTIKSPDHFSITI